MRFRVIGGMGPAKALWAIWDSENRSYVDSGTKEQMQSLADALNAANKAGSPPPPEGATAP